MPRRSRTQSVIISDAKLYEPSDVKHHLQAPLTDVQALLGELDSLAKEVDSVFSQRSKAGNYLRRELQ